MGYLHDADSWLEQVLEKFANELEEVQTEDDAEELFQETKKVLKEKLLESFNNGKDSSRSFVKKSADNVRRGFGKFRKSSKPRS